MRLLHNDHLCVHLSALLDPEHLRVGVGCREIVSDYCSESLGPGVL